MTNSWEEKRPSRLKVLHTYSKRLIRWRRNSYPYLSGDLFSDMSDASVYPPRFRGRQPKLSEIRSAKVIFCPSDKLSIFLDEYYKEISAKVIVCGNSDYEFFELPSKIPPSINQLFLQNSFVSDNSLVTTLPIGIENFRWGVNGNPKNLSPGRSWVQRDNKILIGPFGLTHPIRNEIRNDFLTPSEGIDFISNRTEPAEYARLSREVRYVAAVRGNGIDTHRHWETLYRGGIPIIMKDEWSSGLNQLQLPFLEVVAWSPENLRRIIRNEKDRGFSPEKMPALWWPYWKKLIASYL
jgi:hypothetical protein